MNANYRRNCSFLAAIICCSLAGLSLEAQVISNADGSALTTKYCYQDSSFGLMGTPAGGSFSGCGMSMENGTWYFNPVQATQGISVFPYQCDITYTTASNQSITKAVLIHKPVVIAPPLTDTGTCSGAFRLSATTLYAGAYDYVWTPAGPLQRPDTSITEGLINQTTRFVLRATDHVSGCTGSDSLVVTKYPVPNVEASPATININAREQVQLRATGADRYYWESNRWLSNDTAADPVAYPQAPVVYTITGSNEFGCSDTASVRIRINEAMIVPNAFSPNGDGINDFFRVENIGYQGVETFAVYNRWGQCIFRTLDAVKGWDGTQNGIPVDAGNYYYLIRFNMLNGTENTYKGDVLLIR